jgi:hypothetical protein
MQVFRYFLYAPKAENIIQAAARKPNVSSLRAEWQAQPAPATWAG